MSKMQNPLPWHDEWCDGKKERKVSQLCKILVFGNVTQAHCEEQTITAEFDTIPDYADGENEEAADLCIGTSEAFDIGQLYVKGLNIFNDGSGDGVPVIVRYPKWSSKFKIICEFKKSKRSRMIADLTDAGESTFSVIAADGSIKLSAIYDYDEEKGDDIVPEEDKVNRKVMISATRYALPSEGYPVPLKKTEKVILVIDGETVEIPVILRRTEDGGWRDRLELDFSARTAYVHRFISVTGPESDTAPVWGSYEVVTPTIEQVEWPEVLDKYIGKSVTVKSALQNGEEVQICHREPGILDGIPPVRDSLISAFDGYNNNGLFRRQRFDRNWRDLMGKSKFSTGTFRGYPMAMDCMYMRGNTALSDLVQELGDIIVHFSESDVDPDSTDTEEKYKESALILDAHGALEVEEIEEEISKEDGNTETIKKKIYNCVPDGTHFPYAYIAGKVPFSEGYCEILLPYTIDPETGMTVQIISKLENWQDNFVLSTKNSWYDTSDKMPVNPFDDYSLLIRNLNGNAHVYVNSEKALEGIIFSGEATIDGYNPVYEAEGGMPFDLGIGFRKDSAREVDKCHSRGISIYAIYVYNRILSKAEIEKNMDYAGQRFGFSSRVRCFPKLEDGGACTTLDEGLAHIGIKNAEMSKLMRLVWEINLEHQLYRPIDSAEWNEYALSLLRAGKLKRPTEWDYRRTNLKIETDFERKEKEEGRADVETGGESDTN